MSSLLLAYGLPVKVSPDKSGGVSLNLPSVSSNAASSKLGGGPGAAGAALAEFALDIARPAIGEALEQRGIIDDAALLAEVSEEFSKAEAGAVTPGELREAAEGVIRRAGELLEDAREGERDRQMTIDLGEVVVERLPDGSIVTRLRPYRAKGNPVLGDALAEKLGIPEGERNRLFQPGAEVVVDEERVAPSRQGEREGQEESRRGYPCDCPDQVDRSGRRCGGRCARRKRGGRSPLCGPSIVELSRTNFGPEIGSLVDKANKVLRGVLEGE